MNLITEEIQRLKEEKKAVILAHYYVEEEIQEIADYIGDSYYLSKIATQTDAEIIVFCGVSFMGESAKILNPDKKVLMPDSSADCPMAHMADIEHIKRLRAEYDDLAVVCYINSTAALKCHADVCVTSANALNIVRALPNHHILFIPDENLGRYVASKVPEKTFIFNDGYCPIHKAITRADLLAAKDAHPGALVLAHPECTPDVLALSDFIGSTSGIIQFAAKSPGKEFIISTETGVFYELKKENPDKQFYPVRASQICPDMKKITLEKVRDTLLYEKNPVTVEKKLADASKRSLNRMLELAKLS